MDAQPMNTPFFILLLLLGSQLIAQPRARARDLGVVIGVLSPGQQNAITDVAGVKVGHFTKIEGAHIRTGATAIVPHAGNLFQEKVPAAVFVGNGFGKLAGTTQVAELGNIEAPIVLTNTLSVSAGIEAAVRHTLAQPGNEQVQSVNAMVGETNDGYLNDIRGMHLSVADIRAAIESATNRVTEGAVGAGTGTICFGFKGGIGTSSRKLPASLGGYTVGVLVQSNFGGVLQIDGVPVGEALGKFSFREQVQQKSDGSCMIVVATDAPVDARNLERMAKRAMMGLAKTGGIASNGSGDYVIAFSTHQGNRVPHTTKEPLLHVTSLPNDAVTPLFLATIEATEEAIINSLFMAESMEGKDGHRVEALPLNEVLSIMKKHNAIKN
jgi:D-aminopeptidase